MIVRKLQILHLFFIFLVPVLFAIFRINSSSGDIWRDRFDVVIAVSSSIWVSLTVIGTLIWGIKEQAKVSLVSTYRKFLTRISFLVISNLILTLLVLGLVYQLTMYRQVQFRSNIDAEIYLNDEIGENYRIGELKANQSSEFRLHIGNRHIVFKDITNDNVIHSELLNVSPFWKDNTPIILKKELEKDKFEETTY